MRIFQYVIQYRQKWLNSLLLIYTYYILLLCQIYVLETAFMAIICVAKIRMTNVFMIIVRAPIETPYFNSLSFKENMRVVQK